MGGKACARSQVRRRFAVASLYIFFFTLMALLLAIMLYGVFTEGKNR
jgi:Trk-type K+ transport system membrane component